MDEFSKKLRHLYELAYSEQGYSEVIALAVDPDADSENNSLMKECVQQGYRFVDENLYGGIDGRIGKIVIFAKGERKS